MLKRYYKILNSRKEQVADATHFKGLPLYRFFRSQEQAQCLLDGKVWISTLKKCREFECPQQGDPHEGTSVFEQEYLVIEDRFITEHDYLTAQHAGIGIPPPGTFQPGRMVLQGNKGISRIPNGFLLCTTNTPSNLQAQSSEWQYGVKITLGQSKFFKLLTHAILRHNIPISHHHHAWADYDTSRTYNDYKQEPQHLAFIKPDLHRAQSEYRFFWSAPHGYNYPDGILIDCPEIKPYLTAFNPSQDPSIHVANI